VLRGRGKFQRWRAVDGGLEISTSGSTDDARLHELIRESHAVLPRLRALVRNSDAGPEPLVLLKCRRDGRGLDVRRLSADDGLAAQPLVYKNLGAFDLDRVPGTVMTGAEREAFRELFGRVAVVEVTGGVDFGGLIAIVDKLLSA